MERNCPKCEKPFKEDDEVKGVFYAYWHVIPSQKAVATTRPHDAIPETFEHVNCRGAREDQ